MKQTQAKESGESWTTRSYLRQSTVDDVKTTPIALR